MDVVWMIFIFVLGACVGSFMNVLIYRLPRGQSIVFPPSHCPDCGRHIRWYDNIPLLSWLALKGKCRFCNAPISPRYLLIEGATATVVAGLYVCYFLLDLRDGTGTFRQSWPMFVAHATLLCGLLVCAAVDIESWIVPLEVCWVASVVGVISTTVRPHAFLGGPRLPWAARAIHSAGVSQVTGAMSIAAMIGLAVALILMRYGHIQQSFLDASDRELDADEPEKAPPGPASAGSCRVSPRKEILREVVFLGPAILLAVAAYVAVTAAPPIADVWKRWHESGWAAEHLRGLEAALFGYLVGGLWVWGTRILGTLAFGRLAMGMGDVHIMAAVGAVGGWTIPSAVFFIAPVFGLIWALHLWASKDQRELPYGPWLAAGTLVVMVFHDAVVGFFMQSTAAIELLF